MSTLSTPIPPDLVVTERLAERPARTPDFRAESLALTSLARGFAGTNANAFREVTEAALHLCGAQSAGISLIERDGNAKIFRWVAVSGAWAKYLGGSLPRDASPCGLVVDAGAWQLMAHPHTHYIDIRDADPPIVEVLLVPFHILGEIVGTVWVIAHDQQKVFDAEDLRLMTNLADFAGAAYLTRERLVADAEVRDELTRSNERLKRSNERLWAQLGHPSVPSEAREDQGAID
ncbi:MAG: GAF domain-containing protein [Usitatibacter sp.]